MSTDTEATAPAQGDHCASCGRPLLHPRRVTTKDGEEVVLGRVCARKSPS